MREEKYTDMSLTDEQASLLGFKSFPESEQYIQVKDVRYTLDEFNRIGDYLLGRNLSNDQQVVLNQLCQIFMKQSYKSKMQAVYIFINKCMSDEFLRLDRNESNQVLAAFAEWGMKEGPNEL